MRVKLSAKPAWFALFTLHEARQFELHTWDTYFLSSVSVIFVYLLIVVLVLPSSPRSTKASFDVFFLTSTFISIVFRQFYCHSMTTRPRHTRPNSAVYLGSDPLHLSSTPPGIPDLPEPPSPVSSTGSGLPSPPATNSTGSGSTGDPASIVVRGTTKSTTSMINASNLKAFHAAFTDDPPNDDDDDDDDNYNGNGEDDTARLNRRYSLKSVSVNENTMAIQRALTLKERTRLTIDKLSSYSRNTPSPSAHTRSSDSSSSTSRHRLLEQHHSGSETERELIDSDARPSTPKLHRTRLVSAPASPGKALLSIKQSNSTSSSSSESPARSRKRVSMAASDFAEVTSGRRMRSPDEYKVSQTSRRFPDVAQAALAAVASSRGRISPTASAKKRQPLPKEFFEASASVSTTSASRGGSSSSSNPIDNTESDYENGRVRLVFIVFIPLL